MPESSNGIFSALPSKTAFIAGLVTAVLAVGTLGFLVLLGVMFSSDRVTPQESDRDANVINVGNEPDPTEANVEISYAPVSDEDWTRGPDDARVTVIEYSDTECPFCKQFHNTMQQLTDAYKDDVRWVYRHAPLASLHPKAQREAEALECAGDQEGDEGFWAYADRLYAITPSNNGLLDSQLPEIAEFVGLDKKKFETCLSSGKTADAVRADLADAQRAGLRGTPYSVLIADGQTVPISGAQPYANLSALVDSILR